MKPARSQDLVAHLQHGIERQGSFAARQYNKWIDIERFQPAPAAAWGLIAGTNGL
jgi:hypothetical protein